MNTLTRLQRAIGRYGVFRTLRYGTWALITHPRVRWPNWLRFAVFHGLGKCFAVLGIRYLPVTINEIRVYIDPRGYWSLRAYAFSPTYDEEEIDAVTRVIPARYLFVDVGANFGAWSFSLARYFSRILAVEPDRRCYECCLLTAKHSGFQNVTLVHAGLSNYDGGACCSP